MMEVEEILIERINSIGTAEQHVFNKFNIMVFVSILREFKAAYLLMDCMINEWFE